MKKSFLVLLLASCSTFTFAATSIDISVLDTNQDGLISFDEAQKDIELAENFSNLDANKDGFLSKEELAVKVETPTKEQ